MKFFFRPHRRKLPKLSHTIFPFKSITPSQPQQPQPEYLLVKFLGLKEEPRDSDNFYQGLILPKSQYTYLWNSSWLFLVSTSYAFTQGHTEFIILPFVVWVTSINYWWKPDFSWRRYLDMTCVHLIVCYQNIRAYGSEYQIPFYILSAIAIICYATGIYYKQKSDWTSTIFHSSTYILANLSVIILYSGKVQPIIPYLNIN
jgi:hypothetical protein